jgi:hypothetical protein
MTDEVKLPEEATIPLPPKDAAEEAAMQAAFFYQQAKDERARMIAELTRATKALEEKNYQIEQQKRLLAERDDRYALLEGAYYEAIRDRADLEAILAATQGQLEDTAARLGKFEFSRLKRKRNGNGKRPSVHASALDAVSDALGSAPEVADASPVVAPGTE